MSSNTVAVVVDPNFGSRLDELARRLPVWICASAANLLIAHSVREALTEAGAENERITTFSIAPHETPEETILSRLLDIDLHHPEWSRIEVYGAKLTPRLRQALAEYEMTQYQETESGFACGQS